MNPFAHFPPQPLPSGSAWAEKPGVITEIRQMGPLWSPQGLACKPSEPHFPSSRLQPLTPAEGPECLTFFGSPLPTPGLSLQRVGRLSPSLARGSPALPPVPETPSLLPLHTQGVAVLEAPDGAS